MNQNFKAYLVLLDTMLHNLENIKIKVALPYFKTSCVDTKGWGDRKLKLKVSRVEK